MDHIFEYLGEGIITKTSHGIGFCNKLGFKIIKDIQMFNGLDENYLKIMQNEEKSIFNIEIYDQKPKN